MMEWEKIDRNVNDEGTTITYRAKEDGLIDAELKRTPVLITELIEKVTKEKTSKMDIVHELEKIRKSAEQDQRIAQTYIHCLKEKKHEDVEFV